MGKFLDTGSMANHNKGHSRPKFTVRTPAYAEGVRDQVSHLLRKSITRISQEKETSRRSIQLAMHKTGIRRIPNDMLEKLVNSFSVRVANVN